MEKGIINKKTLFIVLGVLLLGVLTVLGTYAYYAWSSTSEDKDATVAVSSVNGLGQCDKVTDNQKILWPVSSRDNGRIVNINAKQMLSEYAYITWTLTIDSINTQDTETNGLKHQSFKYELVNTTTGVSYGSGNFEGKNVGDTITFSNNTENLAYDTNYTFTLYLWIDGTIGRNPSDMTDQTYQFSLVCDITGEGTNKVQNRLINPITDYEYTLFEKEDTGLNEDYVLLTKYIGISSTVIIPDTYIIDGTTYHVVLYDYFQYPASTGNKTTFINNSNIVEVSMPSNFLVSSNDTVLNLSSNGLTHMFANCTSLTDVLNIPNTITDMSFAFAGCSSLVNAPIIPSSVTDLSGSFAGCSSLTGTVRIESDNVNRTSGIFNGMENFITVEVPENSTTYTSISASVPANVTVVTY